MKKALNCVSTIAVAPQAIQRIDIKGADLRREAFDRGPIER